MLLHINGKFLMGKPSPRNVLVNTHFEADIFVIENNTLGPKTYKKNSYNIDFFSSCTCVWPAFLCFIFQEIKIARTEQDILKSFIPMGNDYIYISFLYIIIFYTFVFIIQLFLNLITIHNLRSVHTCTRGGKYMCLKYNILQWNVLYLK